VEVVPLRRSTGFVTVSEGLICGDKSTDVFEAVRKRALSEQDMGDHVNVSSRADVGGGMNHRRSWLFGNGRSRVGAVAVVAAAVRWLGSLGANRMAQPAGSAASSVRLFGLHGRDPVAQRKPRKGRP
jgi:hypothetical protein